MNIKLLKGFDMNLPKGNARHSKIQNVYCKTDINNFSKVLKDAILKN